MRFWMMALAVPLLLAARVSAAQTQREDEPRAGARTSSAPEQHFERALEQYRAGRYRAAIQSLDQAIVLDPESKDLFYNLALVYEKLGELDRAIVALGRYIELENDPGEARRAGQAIMRLRGAKEDVAAQRGPVVVSIPAAPSPPAPARPAPAQHTAGVDGWIAGGAAVAAASAIVGIVFGVRALALDSEHPDRQRKADQSARIANIGLSVGLLAGVGTAVVWVARAGNDTCGSAPGAGVSFQGAF